MATITVTTATDIVAVDGLRSVREAVAEANATAGADTILFAPSLEGQTLVLTGGELPITQDLKIDGDRDNNGTEVILSGGDHSRILRITGAGTDVSLRDLGLTHGYAIQENGGAIHAAGRSLHLTGCTVDHSTVEGDFGGGGVFGLKGGGVYFRRQR